MTKLTINQVLQQAVDAHKAGHLQDAHRLYAAILKIQPKHPDANHNTGLLTVGFGKIEQALPFFKTALEANPNIAQFWYSHIVALIKLEKLIDAKTLLDQAKSKGIKGSDFDQLEQRLNDAEAYYNMGTALQEQNKLEEAIEAYKKALAIKPDYADAYNNMGAAFKSQKKHGEAIEAYKKALGIKPDYADAYSNMGATLQDQKKHKEAINAYKKALGIKPNFADAHYNMGKALMDQGKIKEAINAYKKALAVKPNFADAHYNMGKALMDQSKIKEAINAYKKALAIKPDYAEAYYNIGTALQEQNKLKEAINAYNKTLGINPNNAGAYNNMGTALQEQNKLDEAIDAYKKALGIKPAYAEAHYNMGTALQEQNKLDEAIDAYKKALGIKPDNAGAYNNMGIALQEQNKPKKAIAAYNKALAIKPNYEAARTGSLHQQALICNWDSISKDAKLIPKLGTSKKHVPPFALLSLEDSPDRHLTRSTLYAKTKYTHKPLPPRDRPSKKPQRIRIGYFSTDFKEHPVAYLIAKVLEQHNRDQFDVFGYSVHGASSCEMRQRIEKSFDKFKDVQSMSDKEIALEVRRDKIDIAVDLNGYTQRARTGIFAYQAAPIQINYLGYPGTMGADFINYIIADKNLIPTKSQKYYSERPIYLPHHFQAQDDSLPIANNTPSRSKLGLPEQGFVFCAINASYKIKSNQFNLWMRLLQNVDGSVLWLLETNKWMKINLLKEANAMGIDSERLVFAQKVSHEQYLAQFKQADLYLDSFIYNAGATASNALWAGLPVLTKLGKGYAARMAGSLLQSLGLPELVTITEESYERLALELAKNPHKLSIINKKLSDNMLSKPLFNSKLFTKHLEDGYQQSYQNYFDGKAPKNIIVQK